MSGGTPTLEAFLVDVAAHEMQVLRDDGLYRHIRFTRPKTICYRFDLLTWPGHLCFTGDMGTYVFTRVEDMFTFFRGGPSEPRINPGYWGEKAVGLDSCDGLKEFSEDRFREQVREHWDEWAEQEDLSEIQTAEGWERIEDDVFSELRDSELLAYRALIDFEFEGRHPFEWAWEMNSMVYTFRFLWCCYALAWGIQQYDAAACAEPQAAAL